MSEQDFESVKEEAFSKGSDFLKNLGEAAKNNPMSAALIGMGVLWLLSGSRPVNRAVDLVRTSGVDSFEGGVSEAVSSMRSGLQSGYGTLADGARSATSALTEAGTTVVDGVSHVGSEYADAATSFSRSFPDTGVEFFDDARHSLNRLFKAQPLALGGIGLAIGAGLAAALPSTSIESEYLGDASDNFKSQVAGYTSEQTERVKTTADAVVTAVKEEARKQGLTVESVKAAAEDMSGKVSRIAGSLNEST